MFTITSRDRGVKSLATCIAVFICSIVASLPLSQLSSALSISSLSQVQGSTSGGNSLAISGSGFIADGKDEIAQLEAGVNHFMVLTKSGKVYTWGYDNDGRLGTGVTGSHNSPQDITGNFNGETVTKIFAGGFHSLAQTKSGKIFAWGRNTYGQLGNGDNTSYSMPQDITSQFGSEKISKISAWEYHSLALTESGKILAWGWNQHGQLGTGDLVDYNTPQDITAQFGADQVTDIYTGQRHSVAKTTSGKLLTWGWNLYGQLGNGDNTDYSTPQDITSQFGADGIKQISVGRDHSLVITQSNKVFSWGLNQNGELGNGTSGIITSKNTPQDITSQFGSETIVKVEAGLYHSLATSQSGKLFAWGRNNNYQLGVGDTVDYSVPQDVSSLFGPTEFRYIYAGNLHTMVMLESGEIYGWGHNTYGQLGVGTNTVSYSTPQDITNIFPLAPIVQVESIYFGSSKVETFEVLDANTISLIVPAHRAGFVDVTINGIRGDITTLASGYEYIDYTIGVPNTGANKLD